MATFNGTEGNDTLIGGTAADDLHGFGGNDFIQGGDGADTVLGDAGNDTMSGNAGSDWVRGGAGNDQVAGGGGQDQFAFADSGAANADTVTDFASNWDNFQLDLAGFGALGAAGRFASGDARFRLGAAAQDADDRIVYNQATGQLWYDADGNGAGAAQLIATLSNRGAVTATDIYVFGTPATGAINGTAGDDSIVGTGGNDTINGLGGNDTLVGIEGTDVLNGGDGNDSLDGWNSSTGDTDLDVETLSGGLGDDVFRVDNAGDIVSDSGGIDTVRVHNVSWTLAAGFEHLAVHDSMDFSGAFLTGRGNGADNMLDGRFGWGVHFFGGAANDTLLGSVQSDELYGEDGNDFLDGDQDFDLIDGGAGNDTLSGGLMSTGSVSLEDTLTGGAGADVFILNPDAADLVTDFVSGTDKLRLDGNQFTAIGASGNFTPGDARFTTGFAAWDSSDRIVFNASTGELFYDPDGTGSQAQVQIASLASVTATDFEVVNGTAPGSSSVGTAGNDSLTGTAGDDTIDGLEGNDTIDGLGGDDSLNGAEGSDSIVGGDGNDTLFSSVWRDFASEAGDTLSGGLGNDEYHVRRSADVILADPGGMDSVFAETTWTLGAGLENLRVGGIEADGASAFGNELDNLIDGSGMEHGGTFEGRAGDDTVLGAQRATDMLGGDGNDSLVGQAMHGDLLNGGAGNDTMSGMGVFVFDAAPGAANADTITTAFDSLEHDIHLDGRAFTAIGFNGQFAAGDPRFWANSTGTAHDADDRILFNTTNGQLWYDADGTGGGARQLIATLAGGGAPQASDFTVINAPGNTVNGTAGDDSLVGTTSDDTINGFAGNDTIDGGVGADSMIGGTGDDLYFVDDPGDAIVEAENGGIDEVRTTLNGLYTMPEWVNNLLLGGSSWEGNGNAIDNVMRAGEGAYRTLFGLGGNDTLHASSAGASLNGDAGNDVLNGASANDWLSGGAGNDTVSGGGGDDEIGMHFDISAAAGYGQDSIDGGGGMDWLRLGTDDSAEGGATANLAAGTFSSPQGGGTLANVENVFGTRSGDSLTGDGLANRLFGIFGNDTLNGAGGNDLLIGDQEGTPNQGNDTFIFDRAGAADADSVSDFFSGLDTIQLEAGAMSALGASGRFGAGDARFWASSTGAAHDADDRVVYNTSTGQLWYDADGTGAGAAQLIATLSGARPVAASDIVVANGTPPSTAGTLYNGTSAANAFTGGAGNDTLNGNDGNDTLVGGGGNDAINGNNGNDQVEGGAGNDTLSGSGGQDSFVFREAGAANADTANTFASNWDRILLDNAGLAALGAEGRFASGDARFFAGAGASSGQDASDRVVYNTSTGQLWYDPDGSGAGAAQLMATFTGAPGVIAADITVL